MASGARGGEPGAPHCPLQILDGHQACHPAVLQHHRQDLAAQRAAGKQRRGRVGGRGPVHRRNGQRDLVEPHQGAGAGRDAGELVGGDQAGEPGR